MSNSAIKPSLRELTVEAVSLVNEYDTIGVELLGTFNRALDRAWRIGKVLTAIKETVPHGSWQIWLQNNLPNMCIRRAQRHMELHRSNPTAQTIEELCDESVRKFRYWFVPPKDRPELEGDQTFSRPPHHLTIVNDWRKYLRRVEIGQATLDKEEAKRDLQPMWEWMCELYG